MVFVVEKLAWVMLEVVQAVVSVAEVLDNHILFVEVLVALEYHRMVVWF